LPKRVQVRTGRPASEGPACANARAEEFPNGGGGDRWIELAERIKKGQFKIGKLGGTKANMTEIWRVAA